MSLICGMVLVLYFTVATDCIDMGCTVRIFGFPYLQLPRWRNGAREICETLGLSFVYLALPKGGGNIMHINQTFLLFMNEGKAQLECWAVA